MKINKKQTMIYTIITFLWLIPILLTNNLYRDDYVREIQNTTIWEYAGRPMASIIYKILSLSPFEIFNLYPLPTIMAGFFAIFGMYILHEIFKPVIINNKVNHFLLYFVIALVFFNPFILQNWLYQYDVLSMIMALSLSILAFYLPFSKKNFFISTLILICCLSLYQPATPVFVFLVLINNIINIKPNINKLKSSFYYGFIYIVSHILYYIIVKILSPIPMVRGEILYSNSYLEHFKYNIGQLLDIINSLHISDFYIFSFVLFIIVFSLFFVLTGKRSIIEKIIGLISAPMLFFFIWGPLSLLEEPLEFPREFMATGIIISLLFIFLMKIKKLYLLSCSSVTLLLYFYFALNMTELSQYYQNKYQDNKIDQMSYHLYQNKPAYNSLMIFSYGQMRQTEKMKKINKYLPYSAIISKPDYRWQIRYRMALKGMDYTDSTYTLLVTDSKPEWNRICIKKDPELSLLYSNNDYDIYFDTAKKYTIVWWKSTSNNICENPVLEKDPE